MSTILHIDTSARKLDKLSLGRSSISRALADDFRDQWVAQNPETKFIYRDLGKQAPKFIDEAWIAAVFTPAERRSRDQNDLLTLSDELIDEVMQADLILLSTPMYNLSLIHI